MSRRLWWVVLSPWACTGSNPLFDVQDDDASGSAEVTGSAQTGPTSGDGSATGLDDDGSGAVSISVSSSSSSSSSGVDADTGVMTTGATSETGSACSVRPGVDVALDVDPAPPDLGADCTTVWTSPQGPITVGGDTISVSPCNCACAEDPVPSHELTVTGVDLSDVPQCGYIAMWQIPEDGNCVWGGLAVFGGGSEPTWIVSRSLVVPEAIFGGLTVDRQLAEPCATENCDAAGTYELEFIGVGVDNVITMDEAPKLMVLPFYAGLPYLVDNVNSVIDDGCKEHTAWTAIYAG